MDNVYLEEIKSIIRSAYCLDLTPRIQRKRLMNSGIHLKVTI